MKKILLLLIFIIPNILEAQSWSLRPENRTIIFVGGLETVCSLKKQEELFLMGFGKPKKLISFRHTARSSDVIRAAKSNSNVDIIFFSAGANLAREVILDRSLKLENIYLIEPWSPNQTLTFVLEWSKISRGNVFVGPVSGRGSGILKGAVSSGSRDHCLSLTSVGATLSRRR